MELQSDGSANDGKVDGFAVPEQQLMQLRVEENGIGALLVVVVVQLVDVQLHD